jgi:hypothetical protein
MPESTCPTKIGTTNKSNIGTGTKHPNFLAKIAKPAKKPAAWPGISLRSWRSWRETILKKGNGGRNRNAAVRPRTGGSKRESSPR